MPSIAETRRMIKRATKRIPEKFPEKGTVVFRDGNLADIRVDKSPTLLKHCRIIGDPETIIVGQVVSLKWEDNPGGTKSPTVLASGAGEGAKGTGLTVPVTAVDDLTIENSTYGLRVKASGLDLKHLSFTPAMSGHKHKDSFTGSGWKVSPDGIIHSASWDTRIHPDGMIALGKDADILKLSSVNGAYRIWAGAQIPADAPFSVSKTGALTARSGEIGSWNITTGKIYSDNEKANIVAGATPWIGLGTMTSFDEDDKVGFWVGKDVDTYKLFLGQATNLPGADYMYWDGNELVISGTFVGDSAIGGTTSDTFEINSDDDNVTPYLKLNRNGVLGSIYFDGTNLATDKPLDISGGLTATDDTAIDTDTLFVDVSEDKVYINAGTLPTYRGALTVKPAASSDAGLVIQGIASQSGDLITMYNQSDTVVWRAQENGDLESGNFVRGATGWTVEGTGNAEFNNITARGEIRASVFTVSEIQANAGTLGVFHSASKLYADCTTPASPGQTFDMWVNDNEDGTPAFGTGNDGILRIKSWSASAVKDAWAEIDSTNTAPSGYTIYTCTLRSGSTSAIFRAGTAVVDYGPSGSGFITISADGTVGAMPNINMGKHAGSPWTSTTSTVRMGNLNGILGLSSDEYGLAFGSDLSSSSNPHGIFSDARNYIQGITQIWKNASGTTVGKVDPSATGSAPLFWIGPADTSQSFSFRADGILRLSGSMVMGGGFGPLVNDAMFCVPLDGSSPTASNTDINTTDIVYNASPTTATGYLLGWYGKYGKALATGEAGTNYINNPSMESTNITDGWTLSGTGASMAKSDVNPYSGSYAMKLTAGTVDGAYAQSNAISLSNNNTAVISVCVQPRGYDYEIVLRDTSSSTNRATTGTISGSSWTRSTMSWTNTTGSAKNVAIRIIIHESDGSSYIYADCAQLQTFASTTVHYSTPYFDGSFPGCSWSGTAHNSSSSRTLSTLKYSLTMPSAWSVGCWIKPSMLADEASGTPRLWLWYSDGNNRADLRYNTTTDVLAVNWTGNGTAAAVSHANLSKETWYHVLVSFDGTYLSLYVDGTLIGTSGAVTAMTATPNEFYVGSGTSGTEHFNGLIDDLFVTSSSSDSSLSASIYASDSPIEPVQGAGLVFAQSDYGRISLNRKGLWANAGDGSTIFGLATDQTNLPWGGFTMNEGDMVIGHNETGKSAIRWDQSAGKLSFWGDGGTAEELYIDTDGSLKAGGGDVTVNSDGISLVHSTQSQAKIKWKSLVTSTTIGVESGEQVSSLIIKASGDTGMNGDIYLQAYNAAKTVSSTLKIAYNLVDSNVDFKATGIGVYAPPTGNNGDLVASADGRFGGGLYVGSTATDPASGVIVADTDIYTTGYTDYSSSSTVTGWSSFATKLIYYKKVGKLIFVWFRIVGTSNNTATSFTVQAACNGSMGSFTTILGQDNGTWNFRSAKLDASSNTVNCYSNAGTGTWTGSGTKRVEGQLVYQTA